MTNTEHEKTKEDRNWERFLEQLVDYVRLELAGENADDTYPDIAFYIERSQECENTYYQEFRRQGLQKSLAELRQLGNREQVAGVMQQILDSTTSEDTSPLDPAWYEVAIEQGRAWIDRQTERWRQVRFVLTGLSLGGQPTPAFSGFMSAEAKTTNTQQAELYIAPEGADLQVQVHVIPEPDPHAVHCQLEVNVDWQDGFGDYSGAVVRLIQAGRVDSQTTDALGKARFNNLPLDLDGIEVQVTTPEL